MARRLEASDQKAKELAKKLETHNFNGGDGEEYSASTFGGLGDYMRHKRTKLQNRDAHIRASAAASHPPLFRGLAIWINGETNPTPYELGTLIVKHSGVRFQYLDGKTRVTHIIASNLTLKKRAEFARYKVVRPEWITESIKAGVLLPWTEFRLIEETPAQRRLEFGGARGGDDKGGVAGIGKVDRPVAAPGSAFVKRAAERQVGPSTPGGQSTQKAMGSARSSSSSIQKVVDQPRPGSSSLSHDIVIPPSDELDADEDDAFKFPSYQLPVNRISFSNVPSYQPQHSFNGEPPPPSQHPYNKGSFKEEQSILPSRIDEDEEPEPVDLVFMPPTQLPLPEPTIQHHNPTPPKLNQFTFRNSSPPAPTFPAHKATQTRNTHKPPQTFPAHKATQTQNAHKPLLQQPPPSLKPDPVAIINGQAAYEVAAFIGEQHHPKRKNRRAWTEYLVLWKGYSLDEATWEPERQLKFDLEEGEFDRLLGEWRAKQQEEEGGRGEVKRAKIEIGGSPLEDVIVVRQAGVEGPGRGTGISVDTKMADTRVIRDSLSPEDLMDEDGDFGWGAEEQLLVDSNLFKMAGEQVVDAPVAVLPVVAPSQTENKVVPAPSGSFESVYGTPVDFAEDYKEETLGEDLDISEAPKAVVEDVVSPVDFMDIAEEIEEKGEIGAPAVEDAEPFTMEFSTPVELLEEREALQASQQALEVVESTVGEPSEPSDEAPISPPGQPSNPQNEVPVPPPQEETPYSQMTAEQKMATYLSNPGIREQTCLNPGFLQKYHEESRLHQLSTWKAKLRAELQALAEARSASEKIQPKKSRPRRYILHVDFDCFFAAVSTRDRPDLAGKPVAITHGNAESSTSSDIASCNYAAREFGVKNGMWMEEARKLCPGIVCLPYEFQKYEEASKAFYGEILALGAERVQAVSVDEALVDISNLCCDMELEIEEEEDLASVIAMQVRDSCREKTGGLEVSVGIGGNVLLAKLAMKKAKPAGQYLVKSCAVLEFMNEVEVRELPGIGYNIAKKVEGGLGVSRVGEIRNVSRERLKNLLGEKTGEKLWGYCRGLDDTVVGQTTVRKSVSVDVNWGVRFENQEQAEKFLMDIAEDVEKRMKQENVKGKHLTLKINIRAANAPFITPKHLGCGKCDTINKSITLGVATSNKDIIGKEAVTMLRLCRISPGELRGLGLTVSRLQGAQSGKANSGQKRLDSFNREPIKRLVDKSVGEGGGGKKPEVLVVREENVPPDRPLIKAYVKPKVTTLLDSFSRISAVRKEKAQLMQVQQELDQLPDALPMGTQIDISMGVDPEVLPYLPTQHRAYIMQKMKESEEVQKQQILKEPPSPQPLSQPPPHLGYDIEVWNQIPSEMRAQVKADLEEEDRRKAREEALANPSRRQTPLPPSPRKSRPLPWGNNASVTPPQSPRKIKPLPPRGRRGRPSGTKAGPSGTNSNQEKVLDMKGNDVSGWLFDEGEVDREWFYAVDLESRQHQIAQAVRTREIRLEAARKQELKEAAERERMANAVRLPMPDRQYVLESGWPVGNIEQIRNSLDDWYQLCAEDGPHEQDTEEFATFLRRLVLVENNIPKADEVVRYFMTMVEPEEKDWWGVVGEFAKAVNGALDEIGLAPIDFEIGYDFCNVTKLANMHDRLTLVVEDND